MRHASECSRRAPNADNVAAWFGPEHMEAPRDRIHIDLRVGGRYALTVVKPRGGAEFAIGYESSSSWSSRS